MRLAAQPRRSSVRSAPHTPDTTADLRRSDLCRGCHTHNPRTPRGHTPQPPPCSARAAPQRAPSRMPPCWTSAASRAWRDTKTESPSDNKPDHARSSASPIEVARCSYRTAKTSAGTPTTCVFAKALHVRIVDTRTPSSSPLIRGATLRTPHKSVFARSRSVQIVSTAQTMSRLPPTIQVEQNSSCQGAGNQDRPHRNPEIPSEVELIRAVSKSPVEPEIVTV